MSERKIIARARRFELQRTPWSISASACRRVVANVAAEEQIIDLMIPLTAEPGVIGGVPAGGLNFSRRPTQAIIDQPSQFDFYDGGGLDIAFPRAGAGGPAGNLNVSSSARAWPAPAAFINVSQNAKKVVFVGTFTTAGHRMRPRRTANCGFSRTANWRKVCRGGRTPHLSGLQAAKWRSRLLYMTGTLCLPALS